MYVCLTSVLVGCIDSRVTVRATMRAMVQDMA